MANAVADEVDRQIRPFADWLTSQRKGALNVELGQALADLVSAVSETRKTGTLTLTIKVSPGRGTSLEVKDGAKVKVPEHDVETTLWWNDGDGNLVRYDPDQQQMQLGPRALPDVDPQPAADEEKQA